LFSQLPSPKEVASTIDSHIDEIEMEILHASWTSEFSHSLGQKRRFGLLSMMSDPPSTADVSRQGRNV
jgi:hypothetical protein